MRTSRPMLSTASGWAWFGMTFGVLVWALLIGIAVYVAVRLAHHHN